MTELRELTQHRWPDILTFFGVPEQILNKRNQPCIFCGGKDRARLTDYAGTGSYICNQCASDSIDGFELLMRFTGKSFKELAPDIRGMLGETHAQPQQNADVSKIRAKLRSIWAEAKPLSKGCVTHRYLLSRGLAGIEFGKLDGLRCHPSLDYWDATGGKPVSVGKYHAMVGLVTTPDGYPATLHCTYLTSDGKKADLDPPRKVMTPSRRWQGGAVRLNTLEKDQTLCVAEGIETALSLKLMYPEVCPWACISAGNLEKFVAPGDSPTVYIGADNDESFTGQAAAFALAKKLSGKCKACVLMPDKIGTDWNDELNRYGDAT